MKTEKLSTIVTQSLKEVIKNHGPITKQLINSATKRITSTIKAYNKNKKSQTQK